MAKIRVNKPEAARRQIDAAIRLLFDNADPIAVHTLAAAGARILRDLCEKKGISNQYLRLIRPGMEVKFWKHVNAPANFFKHADKDADEILDNVEEEANDVFLVLAVNDYYALGYQLTPEMEAILWFNIIMRPDLIEPSAPPVYSHVASNLEFIRTQSRAEQLAMGRLLLQAVRARTAS